MEGNPEAVRKTDHFDVEALRRGDKDAFERMVLELGPRLYHVIKRIVGDATEAESLLQETFLQIIRGVSRFRGDSKFSTWAYAIGINLSRASLRKRTRVNLMEVAEIDHLHPAFDRGMFVDAAPRDRADHRLEHDERDRMVHRALDRLPAQYRMIITLRDIEELGTREVARMLGISEVNVRVRLHRGRRALRKMLLPYVVRHS